MSAEKRGRTRRGGPREPGEHLRAELARLGLNQIVVGKATGVSRQTINNIINGRQAISRAMAARLGRLTGRSSDYWLKESFGGAAPRARDARSGGILVDHQILRAVEDGVFVVAGFDRARVCKASLELTVGEVMTPRAATATGVVRVLRGRSVRVVTGERIAFPHDHLARIGATPHLARLGAIASHALHVDPGFEGKLEVCIFNAGERDFVLRAGDPVLRLEIVPLGATPALAAARRRGRRGRDKPMTK